MKNRLNLLIGLALALALLAGPFHVTPGLAQEGQPEGAVYVVEEGDSFWSIAARFRVSMDDLLAANGMTLNSSLSIGDQLLIPGLEGIRGYLTTMTLPYGVSLRSLSRQYAIPEQTLVQLNHMSSPAELYAGSTLVTLNDKAQPVLGNRAILGASQSLFELAIANNASQWDYALANELPATALALPGDILYTRAADPSQVNGSEPGALPPAVKDILLLPAPLEQGATASIQIQAVDGMKIQGKLADRNMQFFADSPGHYTGLQGMHAMTEPGLYTLVISGTLPAEAPYYGAGFSFSQGVLVGSGDYPFDPVLVVSPETIDPAVTQPEDAQWAALTTPVTPEKLWQGMFTSPAPPPYSDCWPSQYGNRRSYNGSAYTYFHTGLDFCGGVGTEILAPAAGRVVFAGPLTVRGNATVIDHGWGVYSAYLHQSEILVNPGDMVQPGQVIGKVGGTGRVTGPHLHWEIWAGGVQVNPMDWLENAYPISDDQA